MRFFNNRWMVFGGVAVVVLALGLLGTSIAVAQEDAEPAFAAGDEDGAKKARRGQRSQRQGRGKGLRQLSKAASQLDLSAEQQSLLDAVVAGEKERREARRASRGEGMKSEMGSFEDGAIDANAVHARIDDRFDAGRFAAHQKADSLIAFFNSLDADQRAEFEALMEKARERRSARQGQRGPEVRKGQRGADFDGERPQRKDRGGFARGAQGS
jgi:Spy/CpxP family protein refolding chaperone